MSACRYTVPDYWTMGEVYERLIEDVCGDDYDHVVDRLVEVYTSWIDAVLCNYNTDFTTSRGSIFTSATRKGKSAPEHLKRTACTMIRS